MSLTYQIIRGSVILALAATGIGWFFWRWLKNSEDPALLIFRWGLTLGLLVVIGFLCTGAGPIGILFSAVIGLALAIVWVPVITASVGRLVGSLLDGGSQEVEPKPFFSIFHTKRLQGKYFEALAEIRRQLDKFPTDFEGQMFLAELQAENLNDLPGAAITVQRICGQKEHTPLNMAFALNRLADWHLGLTKDREAAQQVLESIQERFPNTELAQNAAQKIARLADPDMLLASHDRQTIEVKKGVKNLGLLRGEDGRLKAPEVDQEKVAAEYVAHLEKHPLDTHAREKLAMIYASHYHRLDLAVDQLEQLIQQPNHVSKQVAHWLNVMADMQVDEGASEEDVRATLQRIVDGYPGIAIAEIAQRRMDRLKLEFKGQAKKTDIQIGTYEQNIGLKRGIKGAKQAG